MLAEDCEPIQINEATRWKPKSLEGRDPSKGAAALAGEAADTGGAGGGINATKLSVPDLLMKANAVLNKVQGAVQN